MKTGLFFGSFNPIHIGHLAIANYMVEFTDIQQLWFVISPQNPLKERKSLLPNYHRLELVHLALEDDPRYSVTDIEFNMPTPSYTIDTLVRLSEKYPEKQFVIIMGSDQLPFFPKWKNSEEIVKHYTRYVYPRPGHIIDENLETNLEVVDAPLMEISSSFIRRAIKEGKNIQQFLPEPVWKYIDEMNFYKK